MARVDLPLGNAVLIAVLGVVAFVAGIVVLATVGFNLFGIGALAVGVIDLAWTVPELWRRFATRAVDSSGLVHSDAIRASVERHVVSLPSESGKLRLGRHPGAAGRAGAPPKGSTSIVGSAPRTWPAAPA